MGVQPLPLPNKPNTRFTAGRRPVGPAWMPHRSLMTWLVPIRPLLEDQGWDSAVSFATSGA